MNSNIYARHIADCNREAQASADGCARMVSFVLATIQQQLETVPDILADFDAAGSGSRFAFGSKARGLDYVREHKASLYASAMRALGDDVELMLVFLRVPGLGMVKAGFCCQLFAGRVGCLDVHNIKLYGLSPAALRFSKKLKPATQRKKAAAYVELCAALGGPVKLWAAWCEYKAGLAPKNWDDGADVSVLHVECLRREYRHTVSGLFDDVTTEPRFKL